MLLLRHKAYTLVEIMIVIMLVSILSALLLPVMQSSKDTAKLAVCTMNMKQIYNGLMTQAVKDESGLMPPDPYQWEFYAESLVESDVMICPMETNGNHFKIDEGFEFLPEPPEDLMQGTKESDDKVFVFREQAAIVTPQSFKAITKTGRYGRGDENIDNEDVTNDTYCYHHADSNLPAGLLTDVYYFSYDPATSENQGNEGEIWFGTNDRVWGYVGTKQDLATTDGIVGLPDYDYPYDLGCRGVDHCSSGKWADSVEIPRERRSIIHQFAHASTSCKDDFRVFTTPGSGSSYAMNVEVPSHPSSEHQILLTDSKVPWVNFTDGVDTHDFTFDEAVDDRHFGKVNVLLVDGTVELMDAEKIMPTSNLWRR